MKQNLISGVFGAIITLILLFLVLINTRAFNYSAIYILNNNKTVMQSDSIYSLSVNNDTISIKSKYFLSEKVRLLREMEQKGILLTPNEYTSQVSSFYNTIISFLIFLFAIFSFLGYYSIRLMSKKDIANTINDLMDDSVSFRNRTTESITAIINDTFVSRDEFEEYRELTNTRISSAIEREIDDDDEEIILQ